MYNEKRKKKYILENNDNHAKAFFDKIELYETELDKDLADCNHDEFLLICEKIEGYAEGTFKNLVSTFHKYRDYCYQKGYSKQREHLSSEDIKSCLKKKQNNRVISYKQYIGVLENTDNPMDRFLVMAQYEGVFSTFNVPDIYQLKIEHFIKCANGYEVEIAGKKHIVSEPLFECAKESQNTYELRGRRKDPLVGDGIIKYKRNKKNLENLAFTRTDLNGRIRKVKEKVGLSTKTDFYFSGAIHYILRESHKRKIDYKEYLKKYVAEFSTVYDYKSSIQFIYGSGKYFLEMQEEILSSSGIFGEKGVKCRTGIDYIKIAQRNREIGDLGESFVFRYEKDIVREFNLPEEKEVVWKSKIEGDGLGYDILSYDSNGNEKYIEVKTTTGDLSDPFYVTKREFDVSKEKGDSYYLYRVYQMDMETGSGKIEIRQGELSEICKEASVYRAWLGDIV